MWVVLGFLAVIVWFVGCYIKENKLKREIPVVVVLSLISIAFMLYYNHNKFEVSIAGAIMNLLHIPR